MSDKKGGDGKVYDLSQCLTLSLSGMERNDSLLIVASYFWFNTLNAFVFSHDPMTITLADVYMLTGLRIIGPIQPYEFLGAGSKKLAKISDCIGWASYIHVDRISSAVLRGVSHEGRLIGREACNQEEEGNRDT